MTITGVVEVVSVEGAQATSTQPADLLIEIPHGATDAEDFTRLAALLDGPLPPGLIDFFHVNTDAGAPELGLEVALAVVERQPQRRVELVRSRVPRTFVDCNRRLDATAAELKAGGVTPGLMPWITTASDRTRLLERYHGYVRTVEARAAAAMPRALLLALHTYAPRSVGVEVSAGIVEALHAAYRPEVEPTWPMRPPIDVIGRTPAGDVLLPEGFHARLSAAASGHEVGLSATYPLHDSTLAHAYAMRWPGRVVCLEVRRDLVAEAFVPFAPVVVSRERAAAIARMLTAALVPCLP